MKHKSSSKTRFVFLADPQAPAGVKGNTVSTKSACCILCCVMGSCEAAVGSTPPVFRQQQKGNKTKSGLSPWKCTSWYKELGWKKPFFFFFLCLRKVLSSLFLRGVVLFWFFFFLPFFYSNRFFLPQSPRLNMREEQGLAENWLITLQICHQVSISLFEVTVDVSMADLLLPHIGRVFIWCYFGKGPGEPEGPHLHPNPSRWQIRYFLVFLYLHHSLHMLVSPSVNCG